MADVTPRLETQGPADAERACPKCGAHNSSAAGFCWQCYTTFAPAAVSSAVGAGPAGIAPYPRGVSALPQSSGIPVSAPSAPGGLRIGASIVGALVAAVVGWLVVGKLFATNITLPESVAGFSKVTSPDIEKGIDQFHEEVGKLGAEGDLAFYGTAGVPRLSLVWYRDPSKPEPDAAFSAFSSGFGSTSGSAVDTSAIETETVEGVEYLCAPVEGSFRAAICMWQEDEIYWFVLDVSPGLGISSSRDLAVQAKHAVDAA